MEIESIIPNRNMLKSGQLKKSSEKKIVSGASLFNCVTLKHKL